MQKTDLSFRVPFLILIIAVIGVLAKVDYAIHGYAGYYPPREVVEYHWFWQWIVGMPLLDLTVSSAYWAGASHTKRSLPFLILIIAVITFFGVLAKVDYAIHGYAGYYPPKEVRDYHWFWQWTVGMPLLDLTVSSAYWAGAPDTKRSLKIAVGLFLTVIALWLGMLEDFFYFILNGLPFPSGVWTWFNESPVWLIFGTWTTSMHFIWLSVFALATATMWLTIFRSQMRS